MKIFENFNQRRKDHFVDEPEEWMNLSPAQRFEESAKLWPIFLTLGGSLDPQPDPQSPFYFQET